MPVPLLPRDYRREPTLLTPQAVHVLVRELLDYANAHQTWVVAVADKPRHNSRYASAEFRRLTVAARNL